jgi:hypothetical protein
MRRLHTYSKRMWLGMGAFLAFVSFVALPAQNASAHYVYKSGYMWQDSWECVWGRSEVSHGNGNGYSRSDIQVKVDGDNGTACAASFYRPAGYIRVRQIFMAQLAPGWGYCRDTGNLYNSSNNWVMTVTRTHGGKCGSTNYQTQSIMHELNGSWKGGTLWSGSHWL